MTNRKELLAQLPALDPVSRRRFLEANLNKLAYKLAPVGGDLRKWRYETQSAPDHWRNHRNVTVSTCLACWEWRLAQYEGRV